MPPALAHSPQSPDARRRADYTNYDQLRAFWNRTPNTLCHGDAHAGNVFFRKDGTAGFLDWQVRLNCAAPLCAVDARAAPRRRLRW